MYTTYLGLGTNLGDKIFNLDIALEKIEKEIGQISKKSSIYETEAWGVKNQDNYYNLVIEVKTRLLPLAIIQKILQIEVTLGRIREKKWDSRIIDIDILFFENYIISTDNLHIPHPFLEKRNFVIQPLNEIVTGFFHPKLRKSVAQLASESKDENWIKKL